tara:strand:+ start:1575 stop:2060 length:486 start_codon:yes stop_codon:yes gene_type:complete
MLKSPVLFPINEKLPIPTLPEPTLVLPKEWTPIATLSIPRLTQDAELDPRAVFLAVLKLNSREECPTAVLSTEVNPADPLLIKAKVPTFKVLVSISAKFRAEILISLLNLAIESARLRKLVLKSKADISLVELSGKVVSIKELNSGLVSSAISYTLFKLNS